MKINNPGFLPYYFGTYTGTGSDPLLVAHKLGRNPRRLEFYDTANGTFGIVDHPSICRWPMVFQVGQSPAIEDMGAGINSAQIAVSYRANTVGHDFQFLVM